MANKRLDAGKNPGATNSVSPMGNVEFTQNINRHGVEVKRVMPLDSSDLNVPGQGNVARAVGGVKEGSARAYADAMDSMCGGPDVERDAASGK